MNLTRRSFLKGLAATAGALLLPPTLTDNAEAARRFWPGWSPTMVGGETVEYWDRDWQSVTMARHLRLISRETALELLGIDTTHLSDPSLGIPTGQAGGRPPSPYLNDTFDIVLPADDFNPFISTKLRTA
jgi:hypothetical protein